VTSLPFDPDDLQAVFFDLDGTLIETDDVDVGRWARRIARAYRDPGARSRSARRAVMALETPVNTAFTVLDALGLDTWLVRLLIRLQGTGDLADIPPVAGAEAMLRRLGGRYRLGIVSTRSVKEERHFAAALEMADVFGVFAGRDTTWRIKPHPEPVLYAARTLGVDPARCLMVGDTTVDVRAGKRAGAWTCAVLSGYGERAELERARADVILDHPASLGDLLLDPA
jgi:phosphoglycolate phosphatase